MVKSYTRGFDLPPRMRDSLLADADAAAGFNALGAAAQQRALSSCYAMNSRAEIDEFIRLTDNFMFTELACTEISRRNTGLL